MFLPRQHRVSGDPVYGSRMEHYVIQTFDQMRLQLICTPQEADEYERTVHKLLTLRKLLMSCEERILLDEKEHWARWGGELAKLPIHQECEGVGAGAVEIHGESYHWVPLAYW
jgi:hypothetical protein